MKRLFGLVALLACLALVAAAPTYAASPGGGGGMVPQLCKYSCGGSWGAEEHAKVDAEKHTGKEAVVWACLGPFEEHTQWRCEGEAGGQIFWLIGLTAYGYETYWESA